MYALIVAAVLLIVGTFFLIKTDDGSTGTTKVPKGTDKEAIGERTRQLMESEGIPWSQAWALAVKESRDPTDSND